jgi:hypothetical protein
MAGHIKYYDDEHRKLREKVARHRSKPEHQVRDWWRTELAKLSRLPGPPREHMSGKHCIYELVDGQGVPVRAVVALASDPPPGVVRSTLLPGIYGIRLARELARARTAEIQAIRAQVGL